MWWNVENLFDTKNDKHVDDREFMAEEKCHKRDKRGFSSN